LRVLAFGVAGHFVVWVSVAGLGILVVSAPNIGVAAMRLPRLRGKFFVLIGHGFAAAEVSRWPGWRRGVGLSVVGCHCPAAAWVFRVQAVAALPQIYSS